MTQEEIIDYSEWTFQGRALDDVSLDSFLTRFDRDHPNVCDRAKYILKRARYYLNRTNYISFAMDLLAGRNSSTLNRIESPIEQIFFVTLLCVLHEKNLSELFGFEVCIISQESSCYGGVDLTPDFAFYVKMHFPDNSSKMEGAVFGSSVIVECDGHNFHEKTKQQVSRDNRRINSIQESGTTVLRFSGSDIFNFPYQCAVDTYCSIIANMEKDSASMAKEFAY